MPKCIRLYWSNTTDTFPRMEKHEWKMWMKVNSVYDGDTITVLCFYNGSLVRWRCRMVGYDSPEMRTKNANEKEAAVSAREFLKTLLPKGVFLGPCKGLDKYGRLLLDLKHKSIPIKDIMILNTHGYAYEGRTKQPWSEEAKVSKMQ